MKLNIGIKREFDEMNKEITDSENMSTSTNSINTTPTAPFASLLPPLNKKQKLMQTTTNIVHPTWDEHAAPQHLQANNNILLPNTASQMLGIAPININAINNNTLQSMVNNNCYFIPVQSIANTRNTNTNNALSLDNVLSTLSNLKSINTTQLNALKKLILTTNEPTTTNITSSSYANNTPISSLSHIGDPLSNVTLCTKDIKRASCHQCKTKKDVSILFYCTKTRPCSNDSFKRKRCRKKYCESCMAKYYSYNDVNQLRSIKDAECWCWECPACIGICTCRACKRKKATNNTNNVCDTRNNRNDLHCIAPPRYVVPKSNNMDIQQRYRGNHVVNNNNNNGLVHQILSNPNLRVLFE